MLGETQKPILPHPRSERYTCAPKTQIPISSFFPIRVASRTGGASPTKLLAAVLWLSTLVAVAADPLDEWAWRNPSLTCQNLQAIAYGNGTFVSVGNLGIVFTSTNGIDWTQRSLPGVANSPTDHTLFGVAYGQDKFVVLGSANEAFYSSDGQSWLRGVPEIAANGFGHFLGVTYAEGLFVAVGRNGEIQTSTNGVVWSADPLPSGPSGSADLSAVAFGGGRFTTVSQRGELYTSTNGLTWLSTEFTVGLPLYGVAYGNGQWVAVGDAGTVLASTNGLQWSLVPPPTTNLLISVTFTKGIFLALGGDDTAGHEKGVLLSSTDGLRWEEKTPEPVAFLTGVATSENIAIAVGYRGSTLTSTDMDAWQVRSSDVTSIDLFDVAWATDRFAVGGFSDVNEQGRDKYVILNSLNGKNWNQVVLGEDAQLLRICAGNGLLVAVGEIQGNGEDHLHFRRRRRWSRQDLDPTFTLDKLTFGGGRFVASGARMLYSDNGSNWVTETNSPTDCSFLGFVGGEVLRLRHERQPSDWLENIRRRYQLAFGQSAGNRYHLADLWHCVVQGAVYCSVWQRRSWSFFFNERNIMAKGPS